jgi:pimeloyl-ACP methyl ester carboxylesterase
MRPAHGHSGRRGTPELEREMIATVPYARVDGLRLHYKRAGRGGRELLFIPGWCCDTTALQPQFEHFSQTRVVTAFDPRGYGRSDRPPDGYTVGELADEVERFCAEVGIQQPVVVGHSMGGMLGVELAARRPSLPRALVLIDPGPILAPPETVRFFADLTERLAGPDGEDVRREFIRGMQPRDPALAREVMDMMCSVPLPIATAVIRTLTAWDGAGALKRCDVPALLLRDALDPWVADNALRMAEIKPDLTVGVTVGAGHFHQLEVPEQVNAMIDRFLELANL